MNGWMGGRTDRQTGSDEVGWDGMGNGMEMGMGILVAMGWEWNGNRSGNGTDG